MAFSFDSLSSAFLGALALMAVSIWSWWTSGTLRVPLRVQLRFAAVLLAAFAVSLLMPTPGLGFNVMLLTTSVASAALALTFCVRPAASWLSATILAIAFAVGLAASLAAMPLLVLLLVEGGATSILVMSILRRRANAALAAMFGAVALGLGGLAMMDGGLGAVALFFASALSLVRRALEQPVEHADPRIELLIG